MIASADCYLSLHRAEGFGYTMAEAMFYGVPVIASGYSGNLEYMNPNNSYLVPCKEAFVKTPDGPFQRGSVWGDPNLDAAAAMLRQIAEHPADAIARGRLGHDAVVEKLSASAVADALRPCFELCVENSEQLAAE
jgi:glycosyltransferase involved in cell wall biosynthesis